ncbi:MAG: gamma-glutamyltransferase [Longimicrobiales bacterium]
MKKRSGRVLSRSVLPATLPRTAFLAGALLTAIILPGPFAGMAQDRVATGREYMVSAPTPEAMEAGRSILEAGGNAVDAAAAAAFALLVTDPQMASVGGRSQILIRTSDGVFVGIDGATQAPLRVDRPWGVGHGYGAIPIPGTPAALEEMLREHGTLSMEEVLAPAIRLASEGFLIKRDLHDAFRTHEETLKEYAGTRAHFFKSDGSPYSEGDIFRQPTLARTLGTLAREGARALYQGSLADALVAEMEANGGLIRHDDLTRYRPRPGEVVFGAYRGLEVAARGGNCDGASVIEMLHMLEHFDVPEYELTDPEYIHILAQVIYIARTDEYVPDWRQVSRAHAARRVREIDLDRALPTAEGGGPDPEGDTNHLSVVDVAGNAVAITQSIGPGFGSKVASREMGFFYAYSYDMNDDPIPFQREKTSQSPTMLLKDGKPFLVLGSAGSGRIPGSIFRTIVNVVDHGMSLENALASRRWYIADNQLRIEVAGLPWEVGEALEGYGYEIRPYEGLDGYFARVHAVLVDPETGLLTGGSDPRDYGAAGGR